MIVAAAGWRGLSSFPLGFFVLGSVAAGLSALGQTVGDGVPGPTVDILIPAAEVFVVLAGATAPVLLGKRPGGGAAVTAGVVTAVLVAAAFATGASPISILVLWNLGVPGWLPGIAYAVALGGVVTALWSAAVTGPRQTAIGIVLLVAGGVGMISTYQTGLVLAAVLFLGDVQHRRIVQPNKDGHPHGDVESPIEHADAGTTLPVPAS